MHTDDPRPDNQRKARADFEALIREHGEELPLDMALLLLASEDRGEVAVDDAIRKLDSLAQSLADVFPHDADDLSKLAALSDFLFVKENYRGNQEDYYDSRNSWLDDVLDRRKGIPITLSVLAMEVGRRLGFLLRGVGFPGHFLVTTQKPSGYFLDAFRGGQILRREDCRELLTQLSGGNVEMKALDLEPVSSKQLVARVLQNIKGNHLRQGDLSAAVAAVDRILLLFPSAYGLLRERGLMYLQLGAFTFAVHDLSTYLELAADPPDADAIRGALGRAERKAQMLV